MIIAFLCFLAGISFAFLFHTFRRRGFEKLSNQMLAQVEREIAEKRLLSESELKEKEYVQKARLSELQEEFDRKCERTRKYHEKREELLDQKIAFFEKKLNEIDARHAQVAKASHELDLEKKKLLAKEVSILNELERIAQISVADAKELLMARLLTEAKEDCSSLIAKMKGEAEQEALSMLVTAINRLSLSALSEVSTTAIDLPDEGIKRRLIGREGRNIQALELATGVTFAIDETPHTVILSCHDPIRKEIAKIALKELIKDGRIHPSRIDEVVAKAREHMERLMQQTGDAASAQVGILDLHPDLIYYLGRLKFCYQNGQNILDHSLEVSHLMGILAAELGLDIQLAKRIGLLHDIGKSLEHHKMEGAHPLIGGEFAARCGESDKIVNGIKAHEEEVSPITLEASLCSTANKISNGRLGAQNEPLNQYIKRAHKLEVFAYQFEGVVKADALYAGKEIRVIVEANRFNDAALAQLARDLAKTIEKELSYRGKIKVTVLQEKKIIEYAT